MGHHLTAFFGLPRVLKTLAVPRLRLLKLPQGLGMAPLPQELCEKLIGERDMSTEDLLWELGSAASAAGHIGWLMSDFFGGNGTSEAVLWMDGRANSVTPNVMFRALGVVRVTPRLEGTSFTQFLFRLFKVNATPLDEWDSLGIGHWRNSIQAYESATPM